MVGIDEKKKDLERQKKWLRELDIEPVWNVLRWSMILFFVGSIVMLILFYLICFQGKEEPINLLFQFQEQEDAGTNIIKEEYPLQFNEQQFIEELKQKGYTDYYSHGMMK